MRVPVNAQAVALFSFLNIITHFYCDILSSLPNITSQILQILFAAAMQEGKLNDINKIEYMTNRYSLHDEKYNEYISSLHIFNQLKQHYSNMLLTNIVYELDTYVLFEYVCTVYDICKNNNIGAKYLYSTVEPEKIKPFVVIAELWKNRKVTCLLQLAYYNLTKFTIILDQIALIRVEENNYKIAAILTNKEVACLLSWLSDINNIIFNPIVKFTTLIQMSLG
ncbi:hypothetical protein ACJX0J_027170 [Zea mays]